MSKKVALIILDGFAINPVLEGNAVYMAKTPFFDELISKYPKCLLSASGQEVGLPWGEFGNSEVGHTNLGLGRVVLQDLPQIDKSIQNGTIEAKPAIQEIAKIARENDSKIHLIGIASDGAVHGHINHMVSLTNLFLKIAPGTKILLHLITDGRDVAEKSILNYLDDLKTISSSSIAIASIGGRFFAMDRDKNYDRIQKSFDAITGKAESRMPSVEQVIASAYARGETDENLTPVSLATLDQVDLDRDVFLFCNYRADRAIELTRAFVDRNQEGIQKEGQAKNFFTMTTYDDNLAAQTVFSNLELNDKNDNPLSNSLPELVSKSGIKQFHIAETEKFAHVTYFFSGGVKQEFEGQKNTIIQSEKVESYDLYPQMKAPEISAEIITAASSGYNLIVANYANGDMVGHTGKLEATVKSIEILDKQIKKSILALLANDYSIILTADHGNADEMIDYKTKKVSKEHSFNPVPYIYINRQLEGKYIPVEELYKVQPIGVLADVAANILFEFEIDQTPEMVGIDLRKSLI